MAQKQQLKNLTVENVKLIFKNFSGKEGPFNKAGDRNFGMLVDAESAEAMERDGWNIKHLKPREEDDAPQAWLKVKVNYKGRPPKVVLVTSRNKTPLDQDSIGSLDYVVMKEVDIVLNPYAWEVNGNTGITAYVQSLFVTIEEDDLDRKYGDIPYASDKEDFSNPFNNEDVF